jgi:cytochrome c553
MKHMIIAALLTSASLMASQGVETSKSSASTGVDGKVFYEKRCSICHGKNGQKTPLRGMRPIASMDATSLARKVRAYRDQEERHGAYAIYETSGVMEEATYSISNAQISAIATYISNLK